MPDRETLEAELSRLVEEEVIDTGEALLGRGNHPGALTKEEMDVPSYGEEAAAQVLKLAEQRAKQFEEFADESVRRVEEDTDKLVARAEENKRLSYAFAKRIREDAAREADGIRRETARIQRATRAIGQAGEAYSMAIIAAEKEYAAAHRQNGDGQQ